MSYALNNAIAIDKSLNALLWGSHAETLSAKAWRCSMRVDKPKKRWKVARRAIDWLFFWQINHCEKSYIASLDRKRKYLQRELSR